MTLLEILLLLYIQRINVQLYIMYNILSLFIIIVWLTQ